MIFDLILFHPITLFVDFGVNLTVPHLLSFHQSNSLSLSLSTPCLPFPREPTNWQKQGREQRWWKISIEFLLHTPTHPAQPFHETNTTKPDAQNADCHSLLRLYMPTYTLGNAGSVGNVGIPTPRWDAFLHWGVIGLAIVHCHLSLSSLAMLGHPYMPLCTVHLFPFQRCHRGNKDKKLLPIPIFLYRHSRIHFEQAKEEGGE